MTLEQLVRFHTGGETQSHGLGSKNSGEKCLKGLHTVSANDDFCSWK